MTVRNIGNIAETAVAVGSVSQAAQDVAEKALRLAQQANVDTGIGSDELRGSRVFLLQILIDDSGSMDKFVSPVVEAFAKLRRELVTAAKEAVGTEILVSIIYLNRGVMQSYCRVDDCMFITEENYSPDGGTPLYGQTKVMFGALMTKVAEMAASGRNVQSYTAIISDGEPTDGEYDSEGNHIGQGVNNFDPDTTELIKGLTSTKQHIVSAVSIGGAANRIFQGMGIQRKWILDPRKDPMAFDAAIQQISRASRSASQGAGAFEAVAASDGFR